jgi:methionine-rich copper-binding protein CopC
MRLRLGLLIPLLSGGAAAAHAFLDHASPPVGATVAAPREIRIFFSEPVEPAFSGIALTAADGTPVATGHAAVDPGDHRQLVLPLPPLPPGGYRVSWHVVSVDTHRTEGDYRFTVKP